MKVLVAHNTYQFPGGEDVVAAQEAELLRRMGDTVVEYRRSNDELKGEPLSSVALMKTAIWSSQAYRDLAALIKHQRPDVAHFHNTFPLISPAAYYACRRNGVPVVQTLHNYRLFCPRADLFRRGRVCELCLGRLPWPAILHGCYRSSRPASALVATMLTTHRWLGSWSKQVDMFITPSRFARDKACQGGIPPDRLTIKAHFVHPDPGQGTHTSKYGLFVGRISPEKGLFTILAAWNKLNGIKLKLIGTLGDDPDLNALLAKRESPDIEIVGACSRTQVFSRMKECLFLLFPSPLYETFGLTIIEAFACGAPVITSRGGAPAELVDEGTTGLLFDPTDSDDLARKVRWALEHRAEMARMGENARRKYEERYSAEQNYGTLQGIYEQAIGNFESEGLRQVL